MWWRKYVGLPFGEMGRGPDKFDCWGMVQLIYRQERGIELPSYTEFYKTTNDRVEISETIIRERQQRWTQVEQAREFDAVLLLMRGVPMHVGICTKPGHMVHCAHGVDTVLDRYDSMRWKTKLVGFFRYE